MKSDTRLQRDVSAALNWAPSIDGTGIGVTVKSGIVTLTGRVGNYIDKWEAEHAAGRVAGVRALVVGLRVVLAGEIQRSDADIARAVVKALDWSACLPRNSVRVRVDNGHVTLSGEVAREHQRDAATTVVRWLTGVTGVSNTTTIKPRVSITVVKSQMEAVPSRRRARVTAH
jgi:osmotically-inducible protein OsmY